MLSRGLSKAAERPLGCHALAIMEWTYPTGWIQVMFGRKKEMPEGWLVRGCGSRIVTGGKARNEGQTLVKRVKMTRPLGAEARGTKDEPIGLKTKKHRQDKDCLLYTSPSPRDS